ncbi:MAG TPA: ABC transporter permease [Anaerolineaceae bacterium]|jgi:putative ABC transport system permease protein|nr:ABC transporter permease [Anaerolineaceae bacterium]HOE34208.1 ABC transporter permease [Anaerolineaceae bacterium]HOT25205.1 ABC transporter permease [Anaerolineaceae bacterium]HQH57760.1 ABC transporter permease [Anaerolineaceae bacterium]HQK02734.1 ABC transporter permease [Anaerolineaceae bacterium]
MRFSDLIDLIVANLSRRKGRVFLTAIGVVIGTAAVVTLVSLGVGLQKNATESLWGISDLTNINVYPGYPSELEMKGGGGGGGVIIGQQDLVLITPSVIEQIKAIPGVKRVIIQDYIAVGSEISFGKLSSWGNFQGVDVADLADMNLEASQGVTELGRGKLVIGAYINRNFYDPNPRPNAEPMEPPDLMGQILKVTLIKWNQDGTETRRSYNMEVVGVLKETKGESDYNMYMTLDELTRWNEWGMGRKINREKDGYNTILVKAESPKEVVAVSEQIINMGLQAYTPQSMVEGINSFFTIMQIIFGGVGAIALLVAAIGIANTMTMSILERTREIGIMKAIGATNNNILTIFLGEAAGIGFVGGVGGAALGWIISAIINVFAGSYLASQAASNGYMSSTPIATATPFWLPIFSIVFATLVGLLSGLYPALNAATLVPVDALKYE